MIFKKLSDTNNIKSYLIQKNTENVEVTKFTSETAVNLRIFFWFMFLKHLLFSHALRSCCSFKQCEEKVPGK